MNLPSAVISSYLEWLRISPIATGESRAEQELNFRTSFLFAEAIFTGELML
jgi:hypothetical protein